MKTVKTAYSKHWNKLEIDFGVGVKKMELYDVIIVGGGPGGLSAAYSAYRNGAKKSWSLNVTGNWAVFCSSASITDLDCIILKRN